MLSPPHGRWTQAHTCYNIVELPEYRDSDELRTRLMKALDYAETGFGLA